ncbi:hypothetical protein AVHY2522_22530 [Acidovorax sp. SUPP2522]|uniref:hypothetical protein n=1 Tax=unclassified Acidovorax TaxID=2684926 RepID=UPI00234B7D78|nr:MULTISPECIES: hypothetical protein [unclassified Acidovorax]WCM97285.1 hypothetical protein M5C96_23325 [Acidovorax sp. GBBC 1281]GKT19463.1 hypothetical protein AVHY2522_22530 [Acidovorax sp. SUPP2522]
MLYHPDAASYQAAWAGYVEKADAQLKELEPLGKALSDTIDSLGKRETFESTPDAATTLKAAVMGAAKARLIAIESHVDRVMLGVMMLAQADAADSVTEQTLKLQKEFVGDVVHLRKAADLLLDARVAPHPQEVAWLEGYVMALERHARDHLMEATRHLPPDQDLSASPVGKAALELAASIRLLASEIGKVLTAQKLSPQMAARVHDLTVEGRSTQVQEPPIEEAEPALSAQESAVSEGPSKSGRKHRRNAKARILRAAHRLHRSESRHCPRRKRSPSNWRRSGSSGFASRHSRRAGRDSTFSRWRSR